jgi:integrase
MDCVGVEIGIEAKLEEYIGMLGAMGRKPSTLDGIRQAVRICARWLGTQGIATWDKVSPMIVSRMAYAIPGKESTRRMRMSCFAGYGRWATGRDFVAQAGILWNPQGEAARKWLSREDYLRMMDSAKPRERLILALGATMGLRRSEIAFLTLGDVQNGEVRICGKGHGQEGKVVSKAMSTAVSRELGAYLMVRPDAGTDRLLVGRAGRGLEPDGVRRALERVAEPLGIDMSPHSLRRLYAMTLADAGVPLETIARMMRHESPVTTMRCYLKADPRRMADAQAKVDAILA